MNIIRSFLRTQKEKKTAIHRWGSQTFKEKMRAVDMSNQDNSAYTVYFPIDSLYDDETVMCPLPETSRKPDPCT